MRLLFITQDFPPDIGGIQTYSVELAQRLAQRCERVEVVAPRRPGADAVDAALGFRVRRLPARPDLLVLAALPLLPAVARAGRFDVAFHAQWQTAPASLVARALTGYPRRIVVAAHGRELLFAAGPPPYQAFLARLRRVVLQNADRFTPVSQFTAGLLEQRGAPPARIRTILNGVNPEQFYPTDASGLRQHLGVEGRTVLLTASRLVPRKGVDTVLQALPAIVRAVPDVVYLVAGDGPDRARLEAMARDLHLGEHVRFLGKVPHADMNLYYNACDLFLLPAREDPPEVDGLPLVFLEANAAGKPVICGRASGMPEAVIDGETGRVVPPSDPDALADATRHILTTPGLAARMGAAGRQRAEGPASWDRVADRLEAVLREALAL